MKICAKKKTKKNCKTAKETYQSSMISNDFSILEKTQTRD
jgi:hypothetical protein